MNGCRMRKTLLEEGRLKAWMSFWTGFRFFRVVIPLDSKPRKLPAPPRGFTLVELLVAFVVGALLLGLAQSGYSRALSASRRTAEVAAGKTLITAYLAAAADNQGILMKAYDAQGVAYDSTGNLMSGEDDHAAHRWVWRLAPYLNYQLYGSVLVNQQAKLIQDLGGLTQTYMISAVPSFGLNAGFVGGNDYDEKLRKLETMGQCITRLNQAVPSVIAFVSARSQAVGQNYEGFYYVTSPTYPNNWASKYNPKGNPRASGYVSARYDQKAVVARLDGGVEVLSFDDLRDMRRWSKEAYQQNNSNYQPK